MKIFKWLFGNVNDEASCPKTREITQQECDDLMNLCHRINSVSIHNSIYLFFYKRNLMGFKVRSHLSDMALHSVVTGIEIREEDYKYCSRQKSDYLSSEVENIMYNVIAGEPSLLPIYYDLDARIKALSCELEEIEKEISGRTELKGTDVSEHTHKADNKALYVAYKASISYDELVQLELYEYLDRGYPKTQGDIQEIVREISERISKTMNLPDNLGNKLIVVPTYFYEVERSETEGVK